MKPPNLENDLPVLIGEINTRSEAELKANGKAGLRSLREDSCAYQHDQPC